MTEHVHRPWFRVPWVGVVVGAAAGFVVGWAVYTLATPVLEASDGLLRETQGLVWNLVPLMTVVGGVLGYRLAKRRS